jgi:hemolysin activation/secretion protein
MNTSRHLGVAAVALSLSCSLAFAQTSPPPSTTPTFPIERFEVSGNTLIDPAELQRLVVRFTGSGRSFADVQLAQEALEQAYRSRGFSAVAITLPEQDISAGVVRFGVVEAVIGTITVTGNQAFSQDNVLRSLPSLVSGTMPNAIETSENVTLANENPAKRTEVTLRISETPGKVDAEVKVEETDPVRWVVSLDNTGRGSTGGDWRMGLAGQHANLFDRDQVLTLQYTTAPQNWSDVAQFNVGYRIPLYALGDSVDVYAGVSDVDAGSLGAGIDSFVGKGRIVGMRYTHHLVRRGEYDHHLKLGLDSKVFENACEGVACALLGNDVEASPLTLSYQGGWTRPGSQTLWGVNYLRNLGWGSANRAANYANATHQPGTQGTERDYQLWRLNASHLQILPGQYQLRVNGAAQFTQDPLIAGEQWGLTGANQVRGYNEREVTRDKGYVLNVELYSPELATYLPFKVDNTRVLVFVDAANGSYVATAAAPSTASQSVLSWGLGLRVAHNDRYSLKMDVAQARKSAGAQLKGDWSAHVLLSTSF